ncbi:unnamed protein product [Echinostoma caproni]|uniref:Uncharacterized protein n=1 Tax=Echinostoma caproni TaxID=27848 RepID=A0A183AFS2_9TREM|nr:unnamed protein product [Echinostoma caproni]
MDKSELSDFSPDFRAAQPRHDEYVPDLEGSIYPCVSYVPGRLCRPRMVARSSVNSKLLSNTLSVICISAPDHTNPMPSMQRVNRIPQLNQSANSNTTSAVDAHSPHDSNPPLGSYRRRPISNPLSAGGASGRGAESSSFPASFYPVSVGGGAAAGAGTAGGTDERAQLLNIDDLLIRRNRPTSKVLSRDRHSTRSAQPLPPLVVVGGAPSVPPVISYQENAIQTRIECPPIADRNGDPNVYQCEKELDVDKPVKPPPSFTDTKEQGDLSRAARGTQPSWSDRGQLYTNYTLTYIVL